MTPPRFSVIEAMMPSQTFEQDLAVCRAIEADGIGLNEAKLGDLDPDLERLRASGLAVSSAFPAMQAILPGPYAPTPRDPAARIAAIIGSIHRLAPFEPSCVNVTTGPFGAYEEREGRAIVVAGLRELAAAAGEVGLTVAVEVMHPSIRDQFSFITNIPAALDLFDEAGPPNLALALDAWHVGDSPDALAQLREQGARFATFHVDDRRETTRSWADRVLPGDGILDLGAILGSLDDGGFAGWFELEVISDDGRIEQAFDDSLWRRDPLELASAGRRQFMSLWEQRRHGAGGAA